MSDNANLGKLRRVVFWETSASAPLAFCGRCLCVIVDDYEGANRAEHEAWHTAVEAGVSDGQ